MYVCRIYLLRTCTIFIMGHTSCVVLWAYLVGPVFNVAVVLPIRRQILSNQSISIWDGDRSATVPPISAKKVEFSLGHHIQYIYMYHVSLNYQTN